MKVIFFLYISEERYKLLASIPGSIYLVASFALVALSEILAQESTMPWINQLKQSIVKKRMISISLNFQSTYGMFIAFQIQQSIIRQ